MKNAPHNFGFIVLISTIFISAVLLSLVLELSYDVYQNQFNIIRDGDKAESEALAESCLRVAILRLAENPNYEPKNNGDIVKVENESCMIKSVGESLITASANEKAVATNLQAEVEIEDGELKILSEKEI